MIEGSKAVITRLDDRIICFYIEENKAVEIFFDEDGINDDDVRTGNIYVGRVSNVRKDLNCAFVDIAPGKPGFLPLSSGFERLKQGDEIPVVVTAQAQKNKPFSLSTEICIHGDLAVAIPEKGEIRVSSKLAKEEKARLKETAAKLNLPTGVIIRTKACDAPESRLSAEIIRLSDKLHEILQAAPSRTVYSKLYEALPVFYERIKELGAEEIVTDIPEVFDDLSKTMGEVNLSFYKDNSMPLSVLYGLNKKFSEATDKKVNIRTGGYLYIEPTEALTVIDVNSGKIDKTRSREDLVKETNLEAAKEVFRQLRLRNLSGIIIIDFINFESEEEKNELSSLMKELAKRDPVKTTFMDFTRLSLAEITRQKKYRGLQDQ